MDVSCATLPLAALAFPEALSVVRDAGFTRVDLVAVPSFIDHVDIVSPSDPTYGEVTVLLEEMGLEGRALVTYPRVPNALDDDAELQRRLSNSANLAAAMRAAVWVVDGGSTAGAVAGDRVQAQQRWLRFIEMATNLALQGGVPLAVEVPHAGTLAETVDDALKVLELIRDADVGVNLDTFHLARAGLPLAEAVPLFARRTRLVSVGDMRNESSVAPGQGELDLPAAFRALKECDYQGLVSVEFASDPQSSRSQLVETLRHARRHITELLAEPS